MESTRMLLETLVTDLKSLNAITQYMRDHCPEKWYIEISPQLWNELQHTKLWEFADGRYFSSQATMNGIELWITGTVKLKLLNPKSN